MLIPTIIMAAFAIALAIITHTRGGGEYIQGLKSAGNVLLQITPLLIFTFIVAGMDNHNHNWAISGKLASE